MPDAVVSGRKYKHTVTEFAKAKGSVNHVGPVAVAFGEIVGERLGELGLRPIALAKMIKDRKRPNGLSRQHTRDLLTRRGLLMVDILTNLSKALNFNLFAALAGPMEDQLNANVVNWIIEAEAAKTFRSRKRLIEAIDKVKEEYALSFIGKSKKA